MAFVVTLQGLAPPPRYDSLPWTQVRVEEAAADAGPWTVIDTQSLSPVDTDPKFPAIRSITTALATLANGRYRASFLDAAGHVQPSPVMANQGTYLISLERLKAGMREAGEDPVKDRHLLDSIAAASRLVLNYTDRDFASPSVTETRTYGPYDGSGIQDIDDATVITQVTVNYPGGIPYVLLSQDWFAQPVEKPLGVYEWVQIPTGNSGQGPTPEMGFTRNLDTYQPLSTQPTTVAVTATFGWPVVPDDVQRATEMIAAEFSMKDQPDLQAHAIEGFSESFVVPTIRTGEQQAIMPRAKDILDFYRRIPI